MTKRMINENLLKTSKPTKENRAEITDRTARLILDSEAAARREKTRKLRVQRLAMAQQKT